MSPEDAAVFRAVRTTNSTMYRFVGTEIILTPKKHSPDIIFDSFKEDVECLKKVFDSIPSGTPYILFTMDAEEDDFWYVQGVCYTALEVYDDARGKEFILTHQFGEYWTLQIVWDDTFEEITCS